jgi:protein-S-isoprenylcysteine O-methyltransferase Ste14
MNRRQPEQKSWDKKLFPLFALMNGLVVPVVAGLEYRFNWPPDLPGWLPWAAMGVYILGWALGIWAMHVNQFFALVARLQPERGQTVASAGPYRWVRHPGYLSGILTLITTALLLDSFWACLPALLGAGVLIARTALEDQMLIAELPGYAEYTRHTPFRLLPGVW